MLVILDHLSPAVKTLRGSKPPKFLSVNAGDWVIVKAQKQVAHQVKDDWLVRQVVFCEGACFNILKIFVIHGSSISRQITIILDVI